MVGDFKVALTVPPTIPCAFSTQAVYPDDPAQLPAGLFTAVYGDKSPVKVTLDRLESTIPMRKN